jgi:hypothetical protein
MMDWKEKMWIAMQTMKEACNENEDGFSCVECPFCKYCEVLESDPETCNDVFNGLTW